MCVIKCWRDTCSYFDSGEPDNCRMPFHELASCKDAVVRKAEERGQKSEAGDQTSRDKAFYLEVLRSNQCACDQGKKPRKALCLKCYAALPPYQQMALYRGIGHGFEEAYEEAIKYLEVNVW